MNTNQPNDTSLVGLETARIAIFGTSKEAISKRTFAEWKARGYFPYHRIGKRIFLDVEEVKRALSRRFKINANEVH